MADWPVDDRDAGTNADDPGSLSNSGCISSTYGPLPCALFRFAALSSQNWRAMWLYRADYRGGQFIIIEKTAVLFGGCG
ncbi:hypothetical protein [Paraburkholderia sp. BL21I4N1]|uniref:hypothetical protein n=1 Tax=Paraburkholderia sp. BL21I4N1 TaxID=1938801 RepID=UPI0011B261E9|nr:hypothetical protein [Paraburkholderia sp. BL21I4N1]